ncbi:hypothetical protein P3T76_001044 [Phytophthora citrophthora]|uniref:RxLR effector protein n=1 Tax=Phytophthora citrophthora TaxID=4793 RepID=A0AAD9LUD2_9STRA|nr:hypothetical protein P3T76_001044 [Phytophthora citrophthora]
MQMIVRFFLLLALMAGVFDASSAQDTATAVAEIGTNAVSIAATTSSLANSVADFLSRVNSPSGQILDTVQQLKAEFDEQAAASNQLNVKLQTLLDSLNSLGQNEGELTGIFNGRKLRAEGDK